MRALLLLAPLAVVTAGCGHGDPAVPMSEAATASTTALGTAGGPDLSKATFVDETAQTKVAVDAHDNTFSEQYTTVKAGATVTFTNTGHNEHDVVPVVSGSFKGIDTADFQPQGGSGSVTFSTPGDYSYYCSLHGTPTKGMTGTIRVLE